MSTVTSPVTSLSINRKRWLKFKANKRGYYALWIFSIFFTVSLFSEFIANDKPLLISYDNQLHMPIFVNYSELDFGGDLDANVDYTDPYIQELIEGRQGWMIWPIVRYSYDTIIYDLPSPAPSPPSKDNWLGTDDKARDVVAGILYGFRVSVLFGFAVTIISAIIGVSAGAVQGFYGGTIDLVFQRIIEIWSSMPTLFILIIMLSVITPNIWWLLTFVLLFSWMGFVGVVRAEFLRGRNLEYVQAARALGMSDRRLMFKHILPNAMVATLTFIPFTLSGSVTILTSLDFLGFGLPPGSPSLGDLLAQGKANLHAPWLGLSSFLILAFMLSLLVFIGEAIRDAFDPRGSY
ncbi:MAG: microcin C transport system permease protein [Oceanospirillaceae bacterium]|jgi:microcin C transport system permease protein